MSCVALEGPIFEEAINLWTDSTEFQHLYSHPKQYLACNVWVMWVMSEDNLEGSKANYHV